MLGLVGEVRKLRKSPQGTPGRERDLQDMKERVPGRAEKTRRVLHQENQREMFQEGRNSLQYGIVTYNYD